MSHTNIGHAIGNNPVLFPENDKTLASSNVLVGGEWEIEGYPKNPFEEHPLYNVKNDGTLRGGGKELVFKQPYAGKLLTDALKALYSHGFDKWDLTVRCSTHIHIDCRMLNVKQLLVFYMLLLENDEEFFSISDSDYRKESPFCVESWNNSAVIGQLKRLLKTKTTSAMIDNISNSFKYRSINLTSLRTFGSIELRHSRCISDYDTVLRFINLALKLHKSVTDIEDIDSESVLHWFKELSETKRGNIILAVVKGR